MSGRFERKIYWDVFKMMQPERETQEEDIFDPEIGLYIKNAIYKLETNGIHRKNSKLIIDENTTWGDLFDSDCRIESIYLYVFLYSKILFEKPVGGELTILEKTRDSILWDLKIIYESKNDKNR